MSYEEQAARAKEASVLLRRSDPIRKSAAIRAMGARIRARMGDVLEANRADLDQARKAGLSEAKLGRLKLDEKRVGEMVGGLEAVAAQADPVGRVVDERRGPSGIRVQRVRVPIGVILMIFEARPNVTAEAAALCIRASNAVLLKGGHEADRTNRTIAALLRDAVTQEGLPPDAVQLVEGGHDAVDGLLKLDRLIDLVIPRGGEGLIRSVAEKSRIPDRKSTRLNSSHSDRSRMPSSA